jgi:hypothetical protein
MTEIAIFMMDEESMSNLVDSERCQCEGLD